jgi:hypothetical protein
MKSMTTEGVKLLKGRTTEPEMKKPWVEASEEEKATEEEEKATMAWASKNNKSRVEE